MKYTFAEVQEIINSHDRFLSGSSGGAKAFLKDADLYGIYLMGCNLREANLEGACLKRAILMDSHLVNSTLVGGKSKKSSS